MDHPLYDLMQVSLENIKEMVEINTIVGEPIKSNNVTLIPISNVKMTFLTGGTDFNKKIKDKSFGGVTGANVSVSPTCFLVIENDKTKILLLKEEENFYEKIIELTPDILKKLSEIMKK